MRNPERIKVFCDRLAYLWSNNCPDWRFTQLIENVFSNRPLPRVPFFYCEDDETLSFLEQYFKRNEEVK